MTPLKNHYDSQKPQAQWESLPRYKREFCASHRLSQVRWGQNEAMELCGRLVRKRCLKNVAFGDLFGDGRIIQLAFLSPEDPAGCFFRRQVKIGDYIGVYGTAGFSNSGTPAVFVSQISLLSCAARPMPDKYLGVRNEQTRRQVRYLDVIGNP